MPTNRLVPLVAREPLDTGYVLLTFRHPEVAHEARAGQFVMIKAGDSADPPLRRPFSILQVDAVEETFTLFLKVVGAGSAALSAMAVGGGALCLGPCGRPFAAPPRDAEAIMVAGGYGIAPFLMLSRELRAEARAARVFYGGRSAVDLQVRGPFAELGVEVHAATEDGSLGHRGRVTEPLETYLDTRRSAPVLFACGPEAMLHAVADIARRRGHPCQVSLDPWMGCGLGTCLGCVVRIQGPGEARPRYRCACTEGPVFDAAQVVWEGQAVSTAAGGV
jgi:dihydroorotate dehydrogenase electron transfer subunit